MRKTLETEDFIIYDDVLEKENFERVFLAVQEEDYSIPHIEKWLKVWRLSDNLTMGGKNYHYNCEAIPGANNNYMDLMSCYFKELSKLNPNICGNWNKLALRSYLYGRDSKLSWHNDQGYVSAGIFYCHNYWASTWGGELMVAKTPSIEGPIPNPCLNHSFEDKLLEYYGYGQYITCKPNRLVLTKGGVWHSINRVDKDAGDNVRMSIVAFFINE